MTCVPIRLPLASYVARGNSACPLDHHSQRSRDLSLRASSRVGVLFVVVFATGCTDLREPSDPHYLVLTLPASIGLFMLASVALIVLALLGGFVLGVRHAASALRAADSAAAQYHRAEVAAILDASSAVHHRVAAIVRQTHRRIEDLRTQLQHLQETTP